MIKFTNIVKQVILENSRYEILKNKFAVPKKRGEKTIPARMTPEQFDQIVLGDPTTMRDGDKVKKAGRYTQWLLKQFNTLTQSAEQDAEYGTPAYKGVYKRLVELFFEDLYKTTEDLQKYDRFKNKLEQEYRDINKLSMEKLNDLMLPYSLEKTKASKAEKEEAKQTYEHPGAEVVFRGPNWTVARISDQGQLGKDAACFYGGNDKKPGQGESGWCTSSPGMNYFNTYIKQGPLYVIIPNSPEEFMSGGPKVGQVSGLPAKRYQFHFPSNQYMDANDRSIDLIGFLNENPELKDYFKPEFVKGLTSVDGKQVAIDYPRDSASKYMALYGFDDFFEMLNDDITSFDFTQSTSGYYGRDNKATIELKLPKEISKFKNLHALHLDGVVSELPEELGDLKELQFLSLPNNPKLTSIPKSVADLPNLMVININGSPNVKIPEEVQNKEGLIISK